MVFYINLVQLCVLATDPGTITRFIEDPKLGARQTPLRSHILFTRVSCQTQSQRADALASLGPTLSLKHCAARVDRQTGNTWSDAHAARVRRPYNTSYQLFSRTLASMCQHQSVPNICARVVAFFSKHFQGRS